MKMMRLRRVIPMTVALMFILVTGCSQASPEAASGIPMADTGLSTEHRGALDVLSQLALGTLKLEETADAVTEAQAAELLPLWQTLQGSALKGVDETAVVQKQIEKTLTDTQLSAIEVMQLTEDDAHVWAGEAGAEMGAAGGFFGGAGALTDMSDEDRAAMREKFQNMTDEDRAELRAQRGGTNPAAGGGVRGNGGIVAAGSSQQLMVAVVRLLAERSGQEIAFARPQMERPGAVNDTEEAGEADGAPVEAAEGDPTATPQPTATSTPEPEDQSADEPIAEPTATSTPAEDAVADADAESAWEPGLEGAAVVEIAVLGTESVAEAVVEPVASAPAAALVQVPDTNPGPPFSVEISLNRAEPSPLLEGVTIYKVSGLLRNDGDQVYAVNAVNSTFYDADGFRGSFYRFPSRRYGEWIEHGAIEADFDCMLLAPGETCPFTAEIAAYNMGSFYVHADAVIAEWREPAPVEVEKTSLVDQGSNVRISGTIVNPNTYAIKNVVVNGVLLDANGQITSMGSAYYVQSIAPGASVAFNALIPADAYVTYQVYLQAEGDFK